MHRSARRSAGWLSLLLALAPAAHAGEREWRELKKAYDQALAEVEADRGRDPEASKKAAAALHEAAGKLVGENEAKATEALLGALSSRRRVIAAPAHEALTRVRDARATRELIKAYDGAQGTTKHLLARALRANPAPEVTMAFVRALRDRDADARAAAAAALGARGEEARATAEGPLGRALKDDAVVVRWAAARALEALTGTRPEGFQEPGATLAGLLERYPYDRVAFLLDVSQAAGERAFGDPLVTPEAQEEAAAGAADDAGARRPARPPRRGQEPKAAEPPPPVSAHDVAVRAVRDVMKDLGDAPAVHLLRFAGPGALRAHGDGFAALKSDKAKADAAGFLERAPADRGRDALGALRRVLELSPPPQAVHVFLCGGPEGRGAAGTDELREALADLLWGRDIAINVTQLTLAPAVEPTDERGRQARGEAEGAFAAYCEAIAQAGGGQVFRLAMGRPTPATEPGKPAAAEEKKFPVDLTKPVTTRDVATIRAALREAAERADAAAETFIEDVAACPDRKVLPPLLEVTRGGAFGVQQAVVRGLARNADPGAQDALIAAAKEERDPAVQLLLLTAVGRSPSANATAGLVDALGGLSPDAARVAWSLLARRPAAELAAQQGRLARAARGLGGLADFHAKTALAAASEQPAPSAAGLDTVDGAFLPQRFVAGGVALIVDTQRDMDTVFWTPPAPPEPDKKQDGGRGGRARGKDEQPAPPQPVTRLGAAVAEVQRALKALGQAGAKGNVITTGGRSWQSTAQALDERQRAAADGFVGGLATSPARDVWKALKQAIDDPAVEVVHLLVCGPPIRSVGSGEAAELLRAARGLNATRAVAIHVVYVLGPGGGPAGSREAAARADQLTALDAVYRTLAEESGGRVHVREALASLGAAAPATPGR
ncbi:MAG: hypothetical protein M9894_15970 [Planctomycetes bacterium]|nr:hypothetical protein [Planctomycetota bacterium]